MGRRLVSLMVLVIGLGSAAGGQTMAQDELVVSILDSHEGLAEVVAHAADYRLQVVLGLVEEGPDGKPVLRQHAFRAGAEYFYPASTVKLFAAVAAAQKLAELREVTGLAIDLDTPLLYHPQFEDGEMEAVDEENVESGKITVRQQIRKIFLVSDNQAFNYLYELVGQDGLASSLRAAGLDAPRIVHRLSEFRSAEENLQSPRIDFVGRDFTYTVPERTAEALPPPEAVEGILVGEGYYAGDERIDEPMDFTPKNYFPLVDLQRGLCMLVRPDVDCGGPGFELDEADREAMLEAMSQYPRESTNPVYNPEEYPDTYVKNLLPGLERVVPREHLQIYNKTGEAYGFSIENAWVVNTEAGEGFFLAATLYTNADGILNDDEYEYDEIASPFFADLGEAVARRLWAQTDP